MNQILVTTQRRLAEHVAEEVGVMGGEDELRGLGVVLGVVKETDDIEGEHGVEAPLELVDAQEAAGAKYAEEPGGDIQQCDCAGRFSFLWKPGPLPVLSLVLELETPRGCWRWPARALSPA